METLREQNIHENKKALRARCREIVKELSPEYIEEASHKIADLLLATDAYKNSNTIFCYMSMGGEPVTDEIIERALEDGKRVGIPLCVGPHEMVVKEYKSGDELARGAFGIREPLAEATEINADEFDLAIVPCVACSKDGRRIGHGAGYYVGSLRQRLILQEDSSIDKMFVMIADAQALTDNADNPEKVRESVLQVAMDYLAIGIDPARTTIFIQSQIPALHEMTMYYMNLVTVARVQRNPTVKNEIKMRGFEANLPVGFFTYPISQASDITAFMGTIVPVGEDQEPMIEQCREIVRKFNATYGEVLVEPEIYLPDNKACLRLPGTDGQAKMSKSLGNTIYLSDSEQELKTKVMSMYTDPNHIKVEDPGQVEGNTVFTYLDAFVQHDSFEKYLPEYKDLDELKDHYRRGGLGDVKVKKFLLKVLNEFLEPIRERRAYYEEHPEVVVEMLRKGTELANSEAEKTLDKMKKAMQIDYFNQWNEDYNLK